MVHANGFPTPFTFIIRLKSKGCVRKHRSQRRSLLTPIAGLSYHGAFFLVDGLAWYKGLIFSLQLGSVNSSA
jgi:hypothetical protein